MVYYGEPADYSAGHRTVTARTFVPGVPRADVTGDLISGALFTAYQAFQGGLIGGFPDPGFAGGAYWRVMAAPKPRTPGQILARVNSGIVRNYVATQRRRLTPH
jgi:hypothetical protein